MRIPALIWTAVLWCAFRAKPIRAEKKKLIFGSVSV
jgi:hypothetical protein